MELEDGGAGPEVTEPRPVSQSAVEDGQEGQEVPPTTYQEISSFLIGPDPTLLRSHWSRDTEF